MRFLRPFVLLSALAFVACEAAIVGPGGDRPLSELRNAPPSLSIGGKTYVLDAYLWRDFMPVAPPNGQPLVAVLRIRTTDGSPVPATVSADVAYVLLADQVWVSEPAEEQPRGATAPVYEVVSRGGPKWGPDVTVDVIVGVRNGNGPVQLLRVANRPIHRTD